MNGAASEPVAIVGRGCALPGALDPEMFWLNVVMGRSSVQPVPSGRWRFPHTGANLPHRMRTGTGGYVEGFADVFEPDAYRLPAGLAADLDPVVQWTLYGAGQALREAGQNQLLDRTGLVMGNLSYPTSGLAEYAEAVWKNGDTPSPHHRFSSGLPAQLTARGLGLGLGGFALDAACASSLYAIAVACGRLQRREAAMMIAGGVNAADSLFIHLSFDKLSALSRTGRSMPFHEGADGLLPAEGAAFVALMRLSDAIAVGARVFGVIRGTGLSNTGRGRGPLVPDERAQRDAMVAAYRAAGVSPTTVGLLEGHATGTAVGDGVEIRSTAAVFGDSRDLPAGSVKSNIGHTITAAGAAGLLKALGALAAGVRPPSLGEGTPSSSLNGTPLRLLREAEEWTGFRRAAVSAFGFGGNNAHLIVDAWTGDDHVAGTPIMPPVPVREPLAIVAIGSRVASGQDVGDLRRSLVEGVPDTAARESLEVSTAGLRLPPLDLQHVLPQQLLLLEAAREAAAATTLPPERTMVLVGMGCDAEAVRPVARVRVGTAVDRPGQVQDVAGATQTAAAVIGAMPNMVANRVNELLDLRGPSFTVSDEESSGFTAIELGAAALRANEVDAVLVGAVDLSHEPVHRVALEALGDRRPVGDGAVVIALKRLSSAEDDGDDVLAILDETRGENDEEIGFVIGDGSHDDLLDPGQLFGRAHAAHGLLSVVTGVLALRHRFRPRGAGTPAVPTFGQAEVTCVSQPLEGPRKCLRLRAGETAGVADALPVRFRIYSGANQEDVLDALAAGRESDAGPARLVLWARGEDQFIALAERTARWLRGSGAQPFGAAFRARPVKGDVAFVYSGGSMAYEGMGRELVLAFPELVDAVRQRTGPLEDAIGWAFGETGQPPHPLDQIAGASVLAQLHTRITQDVLGLRPRAALGYSSGESGALASLGAWRDVSPLLIGARSSTLFTSDVVGTLDAPRRAWRREGVGGTRWASYVAETSAETVEAALREEPSVHLMVVNAPDSCVFGGEADACERVVRRLSGVPTLRIPYQIAAHVPEVAEVGPQWRELHHLPTTEVSGVRFYTCATGDWYSPTADNAADAITAQGLGMIDFSRTVERAWEDGARTFIEHGPRRQCTGWIKRTLGDREHLAVPLDAVDGRRLDQLHQVVAELTAADVPVDSERLEAHLRSLNVDRAAGNEGTTVRLQAHLPEMRLPSTASAEEPGRLVAVVAPVASEAPVPTSLALPAPAPSTASAPSPAFSTSDRSPEVTVVEPAAAAISDTRRSAAAVFSTMQAEIAEVHRQFLSVQGNVQRQRLDGLFRTAELVRAALVGHSTVVPEPPTPVEAAAGAAAENGSAPVFSRTQLEQLATGRISDVFGPLFSTQDGYARQVRMPAPPLLLADRVTYLDGAPGSMGTGTIHTETDVQAGAWYLEPAGRMSTGALIEAGQADLLLISWLGIDQINQGKRVYRLLGCDLTFHGEPPSPGETLRYEITVDGHGEHGGVRVFFFHYDAYVGNELRLSMREGQAGFFTDEELANTRGVLWTPETAPLNGGPAAAPPQIAQPPKAYSAEQVLAYTEGRPADCFGEDWNLARTHIRSPRLGEGPMRLLSRVVSHDASGGPWGKGYVKAETSISPDDWFFDGHFHNDPCMPGTLMLDGCFQAMAFHLAACGYTVQRDGWRFEPVPGSTYRMACRGQVTPSSKLLTYEVFVSGRAAGPEPELTADVLCTVDGVRAFHASGLKLRLVPDWPLDQWSPLAPPAVQRTGRPVAHRELAGLAGHHEHVPIAEVNGFRYDYQAMLACAWGRPTEAFGPAYAPFDGHRRLARLPGPPFHFMSRVVEVEGPPLVMRAGSAVTVEYDVPDEVWYFEQNDDPGTMPFSVLMEVVLQASGWLASYVGSALTSETDLLFRNLDGNGTVHGVVTPETKVLRTRTVLLDVSTDGDMIIQTFGVECAADGVPLFSLRTVFGFFPPSAFATQVGLPPSEDERELLTAPSTFHVDLKARPQRYFNGSLRLPARMLLMLDRVTGYWPDAGAAGLGRLRAEKEVDADEWFFKAHFFQDPVQPGSLGVQGLLQLLQFYAIERGLGTGSSKFVPVVLDEPVTWRYRGQVTPASRLVTVEVEIVSVTTDRNGTQLIAEGWLWADGIRIYHVGRFGVGITEV
ncbi:beta-ketoacyl synthase N-terminal-like domain-containing protein [Lentzea sp. NPDC042327]|uniref:beta-ketoacyl synthase N-terminal-like domain-containing protein n=1 Tax=Lentzea sp. NPDC042327 TaxID=3154801 RepID=UPI0033D301B7